MQFDILNRQRRLALLMGQAVSEALTNPDIPESDMDRIKLCGERIDNYVKGLEDAVELLGFYGELIDEWPEENLLHLFGSNGVEFCGCKFAIDAKSVTWLAKQSTF